MKHFTRLQIILLLIPQLISDIQVRVATLYMTTIHCLSEALLVNMS
jgi:hypothetical protein